MLRTLGTNPWFGARLLVPRGGSVFDAEGALVSDEIRERLSKYLEGFRHVRRAEPGLALRRNAVVIPVRLRQSEPTI